MCVPLYFIRAAIREIEVGEELSDEEEEIHDLGDDLLEKTGEFSGGVPRPPEKQKPRKSKARKNVRDARILFNEGILGEAKKILRSILRNEADHVAAKKLLREIEKSELDEILKGELPAQFKVRNSKLDRIDPEKIMRKLDEEFDLGVFPETLGKESKSAEKQIFQDDNQRDQFIRYITTRVAQVSPRTRLDLGVGFLEMGLFSVAEEVFRTVEHDTMYSSVFEPNVSSDDSISPNKQGADFHLSSAFLVANAQILGNRAFHAVLKLETILKDPDLSDDQKIHFMYLMGCAKQMLGKGSEARSWFGRVIQLDRLYRDAWERAKGKKSKGDGA